MTSRRPHQVPPATTPIKPGEGSYPDLQFLNDEDIDITADVVAKVNAGARLLFALYHHPQARELFSSPYMTPGLQKAYMAASKAWGL